MRRAEDLLPLTFRSNQVKSPEMKSELPQTFPPDVPIWVDPERMSGAPCFQGTRVPVAGSFAHRILR